jgi:quercetin dioxygenase-like cupin family protein
MSVKQLVTADAMEAVQHADDDYWYRPLLFGQQLFTYIAHIPPGGDMAADAKEADLFELSLFMTEGALEVTYGEEQFPVRAGQALHIPRGVPFGVRNAEDNVASFVLTFTPPPTGSREDWRARVLQRAPHKLKSADEMAAYLGRAREPQRTPSAS